MKYSKNISEGNTKESRESEKKYGHPWIRVTLYALTIVFLIGFQ